MVIWDGILAGLAKELQEHPENVIDVLRRLIGLMEQHQGFRDAVVALMNKAAK